jgi:hypothetical protein
VENKKRAKVVSGTAEIYSDAVAGCKVMKISEGF